MSLRSRWYGACAAVAVLSAATRESRGQGFLVDRRPGVAVARSFGADAAIGD